MKISRGVHSSKTALGNLRVNFPTTAYVRVVIRLFAAVALLCGCSRQQSASNSAIAPAKIEGDKVMFSTNAPNLAYLAVEAAQERKLVATGLNGRLVWDDEVTARVFPSVSGRIIEIVAKPGEPIRAGDTLAKIKSPDFGQAQADARKAAAELKTAESALKRVGELFEHGAAPQKDVEAAEAEHVRAVAERERTLATLSLYGANPDSTGVDGIFSLKAPISGLIVERFLNPGQEVRADQIGDKPLFVISDPGRLWLYLDVTDEDVPSLHAGQDVLVRARTMPDKFFQGRVEVIGAGMDATTRTVKARCLVDNSEKLLRAEMYVSADVTSAAAGVDIPTKAVFLKDNQYCIFVELSPGQFQRRIIKLGPESNGRSLVVDGLSVGQRVVTEGCLLLEAMVEGENS